MYSDLPPPYEDAPVPPPPAPASSYLKVNVLFGLMTFIIGGIGGVIVGTMIVCG